MESFLVSVSTVALAEVGDRTQFLTLMLAARYRRPWAILSGVLCAALANHLLAGIIGIRLSRYLSSTLLDFLVGASMVAMALWALRPDSRKDEFAARGTRRSAFVATLVAFFIAEIGDKTQLVTVALAAAYANLAVVVAGTTTGMLIANAPVVFLGKVFAERLPLRAINYAASALFVVIGCVFILRALRHGS
jgi:Ca2+/H+ antiporter, TMEM165/GDT1 family